MNSKTFYTGFARVIADWGTPGVGFQEPVSVEIELYTYILCKLVLAPPGNMVNMFGLLRTLHVRRFGLHAKAMPWDFKMK